MDKCPFCGLDPYEYVNVGAGISIPIAVNCCEYGYALIVEGMDYDELMERFKQDEREARPNHVQHDYEMPQIYSDDIPF